MIAYLIELESDHTRRYWDARRSGGLSRFCQSTDWVHCCSAGCTGSFTGWDVLTSRGPKTTTLPISEWMSHSAASVATKFSRSRALFVTFPKPISGTVMGRVDLFYRRRNTQTILHEWVLLDAHITGGGGGATGRRRATNEFVYFSASTAPGTANGTRIRTWKL